MIPLYCCYDIWLCPGLNRGGILKGQIAGNHSQLIHPYHHGCHLLSGDQVVRTEVGGIVPADDAVSRRRRDVALRPGAFRIPEGDAVNSWRSFVLLCQSVGFLQCFDFACVDVESPELPAGWVQTSP